jgi:hypothetical protein
MERQGITNQEVLMSEHGIGRRQLVRSAAGVAAGGALAVGTGVGAASASGDGHDMHGLHGLLGAWVVEHTNDQPADPDPGVTVVGFAAGGVIVATDVQPAGTTSTGAWSMDGNRFRATFWGAAPGGAEGDPGISIRIRARGRLRDGRLSGTFAITGYVGDLTTVAFSATGTFTGTRLAA